MHVQEVVQPDIMLMELQGNASLTVQPHKDYSMITALGNAWKSVQVDLMVIQ